MVGRREWSWIRGIQNPENPCPNFHNCDHWLIFHSSGEFPLKNVFRNALISSLYLFRNTFIRMYLTFCEQEHLLISTLLTKTNFPANIILHFSFLVYIIQVIYNHKIHSLSLSCGFHFPGHRALISIYKTFRRRPLSILCSSMFPWEYMHD